MALPFAGLSLACKQICDKMLQIRGSDPERFAMIQRKLKNEICAVNIDILSIMMPQIYEVIEDLEEEAENQEPDIGAKEDSRPGLRRGLSKKMKSQNRLASPPASSSSTPSARPRMSKFPSFGKSKKKMLASAGRSGRNLNPAATGRSGRNLNLDGTGQSGRNLNLEGSNRGRRRQFTTPSKSARKIDLDDSLRGRKSNNTPTHKNSLAPSEQSSRESSLDKFGFRGKRRSSVQVMGDDTKKQRLEAALKVFFKFVSQEFAPVVILLDDLQWADQASLEMIESLVVNDLQNTELMIIGCVRSEDVDEDHAITKFVETMEESFTNVDSDFSFTQIQIGNFSKEALVELLSELLSKDHGEVQELAQLCVARTGGNIFYTREFLSMLVRDGFLKFHVGTFQWDWNMASIENETEACPNIVGLIQHRIKRMRPDVVELLKLAALLGTMFSRDILLLLWEYHRKIDVNNIDLDSISLDMSKNSEFVSLLDYAIEECCLEPIVWDATLAVGDSVAESCASFQFVHDQVKESILSLIPHEEVPRMQYSIGRLLLDTLDPYALESMFFVVVNMLNCAEDREDMTIAFANLQAASHALRLGAFSSAKTFAENGISRVPVRKGWSGAAIEVFDLVMDLHVLAAQAEVSLGNTDAADKFVEIVLAEENASTLQKCAAYKVKLTNMHYLKDGDPKEAVEMK
ncbi:MAG: hypothetical protein SGILL_010315 [Bacillariaceae sp.]